MPYGWELIMDLKNCDVSTFTEEGIESFCKELCKVVDMKAQDFHIWASDPSDYDSEPDHIYGVSAVQFIVTSSITIHALHKLKAVYINLFTCKSFDPEDARECITDYFRGEIVSAHILERL